jgi:formylmethanofuran dehydrogenase subunit E
MIIGAVTNAMEKTWHAEHFVCTQCGRPFPNGAFVEMDGKPYCEEDYNELFGPKCAFCMKPITDTCITAVGRAYHPEHFYCNSCGVELRGKPYKEHEGEPFCVACKAAKTTIIEPSVGICGKCKKPIIGEYITLHGQRMHPEHFRCEECNCEFKGGNCHEYEGHLYCYPDYLKLLKSICGHCRKPIVGRSVTALGKVWHPEHFLCFTCKEPFGGSTFYEKDGHAYCEPHYLQNFGKVCNKCNKPIAEDGIVALGKHYHRDHFVCSGCDKPLGKEIWDMESKPFCKKCYEKLPKEVRKRIEKKKEGEKKAQKEREKEAKKALKASKG